MSSDEVVKIFQLRGKDSSTLETVLQYILYFVMNYIWMKKDAVAEWRVESGECRVESSGEQSRDQRAEQWRAVHSDAQIPINFALLLSITMGSKVGGVNISS